MDVRQCFGRCREHRFDAAEVVKQALGPARAYAWRQLLIARAIENQCYVIGVNRVGRDGNDLDYAGDSLVVGPRGELLLDMAGGEGLGACTISLAELENFREEFPVHLDADEFALR